MDEENFQEIIKIGAFWRKILGDYEYTRRNGEDLHRWYVAMEMRGPDEIRSYLRERQTTRYPLKVLPGIVGTAPHPPVELVERWLETHEKTSKLPFLYVGVIVIVLSLALGTSFTTFLNTPQTSPLQMAPPVTPPLPAGTIQPDVAQATMPIQGPPEPASVAARPTGTISGAPGQTTP